MAPRYRKVTVAVWTDARFRALSPLPPCGQGLWLYLLTARESIKIPGVIPAGRGALAESLRWSPEAFREAFAEASGQGMVEADWGAPLVFLPKAIEHNAPESPNVVRGWKDQWAEIPDCALKHKVWSTLKAFLEGLGEPFAKAFREACQQPSPHPSPNQEQEQEQEQEPEEACAEATDAPPPALLPEPPPVVTLPCVGAGPSEFGVTEAMVAEWREAFPRVDVLGQVRQAKAWLVANPTKRKTHRGAAAFLVRWLSKAQDQPRGPPAANGSPARLSPLGRPGA